jgi:hypothetical protein
MATTNKAAALKKLDREDQPNEPANTPETL